MMAEQTRPGRAWRFGAASLGLILLLVPSLAAQDRPLTLDEAVTLALEIEQIIINLIKNAVQAMPEHGKLTVSLLSKEPR